MQEWLELLGVKQVSETLNIQGQGERIDDSPQRRGRIPWGDLTMFFICSALAGYLLNIYSTPELALSVGIMTPLLGVALAAESSGCLSIFAAFSWAVAGIINLGWVVYLVWAATVAWGGTILGVVAGFVAGVCVLLTAFLALGSGISGAEKLRKSFSRFHSFLIFLGTSWLGLGLGWLVR
jgi:hypothetical protein